MAKRVAEEGKERADKRGEAHARGDSAGDGSAKPSPEPASLKGTFASVMLLGAFLVAAWVSVFILYVHRN